jgi:hypothetical protein
VEDENIKFWLINTGTGFLLLFVLTLGVLISPLLGAFMGSEILSVALMAAVAAGAGFGHLKAFKSFNSDKVLVSAASGSTVISLIASIQKIIVDSMMELQNSFNQAPGSAGSPEMSGIMTSEPTIQPLIFFAVMMVAFNFPLLQAWYRSTGRDPKYLALYIIPILVYILVPMMFSSGLG